MSLGFIFFNVRIKIRLLIVLSVLFVSLKVSAQLQEPIYFQNKSYDFGEVIEQNGPVKYDFQFVNKSLSPIKIVSVEPSCGCTTSGWTQEAIDPGKMGVIKAKFNPHNRPGYFNKTLTVTTDIDTIPIILTITGNVIDKSLASSANELLVKNGNLRLRQTSFNLGKLYINKTNSPGEFPVYNNGKKTIKVLSIHSPPHIKVLFPNLPSHSQGTIRITYQPELKKVYGFVTDHVVVKTNDILSPEKSFLIHATIEEYFPLLPPDQQNHLPVLKLDTYQFDLGIIKDSTTVIQRDVKYRNRGNKTLLIRYIQSNCSCLIVKPSTMNLKPGEEANLTLKFDPTGREGIQNKAITIYSNDRVNPIQRLFVTGYIDNEE